MISAPKLAARLRARLAELGWTAAELAKRLNQKPPNVSRWLSGRARPGAANLVKISRTLGLSLEELLSDS